MQRRRARRPASPLASRPPTPPLPLLLLLLLWSLPHYGDAACYFSIDLQGQFLVQSAVEQGAGAGLAAQVTYSPVNITDEAIPIWGSCHRRIGNNVILMDSSGAQLCFRCFHLNLRSPNVLQVHVEGLDKCYTNEELARSTCPNESTPHFHHASKEIILYKTRDHNGDQIRPQYCPINGRFSFTYSSGRASGGGLGGSGGPASITRHCQNKETSVLDNCPWGSELNLRYRHCDFPDFDVTYVCLGHWEGPGNQRYLALLNRAVRKIPRYRCALYSEDPGTGSVAMTFSSDSTCRSDLRNASSGYEMLQLTSIPTFATPKHGFQSTCRFPPWAKGRWQRLQVDDHMLVYRDHSTFKTYTARCLGWDNGPAAERFLVFTTTQCGEEMYSCVWIKSRSTNVIEFQMGIRNSTDRDETLCDESNFKPKVWITQGRLDRTEEMPCPISGEYTGVIPDAQGLCARLASDCHYPESMYYAVSACEGAQVYEEREYRCLGQWEENGLTYTYTQRKDIGTYECFVGSIISQEEIYIKEAGDHCTRSVKTPQHGMKLVRQGSCVGGRPDSDYPMHTHTTTPHISSKYTPQPTKPWKPMTAPPRIPNGGNSAANTITVQPLTPVVLLLFLLLLPSFSTESV